MNTYYRYSFPRFSQNKTPTLYVLYGKPYGTDRIKLSKMAPILSYNTIIHKSNVSDTPEEALSKFREALKLNVNRCEKILNDARAELASLPDTPGEAIEST